MKLFITFFIFYSNLSYASCVKESTLANLGAPISGNSEKQPPSFEVHQRILNLLTTGLDQHFFTIEAVNNFNLNIVDHKSLTKTAIRALYSKSPVLLNAGPHISALQVLFENIRDLPSFKAELRNFIATKSLLHKQQHDVIQNTVPKFTPLEFVNIRPISFKTTLNLPDSVKMGGGAYSMINGIVPITFTHELSISKTPITIAMWLDVMGEIPKNSNQNLDNLNTPIIEISEPAIYFFLNRLSEKHGLKPAYDREFLANASAAWVSQGKPLPDGPEPSYEELEKYAARNLVTWINAQAHPAALYELSVDLRHIEGFRLPTVLELTMIYEKVWRSLNKIHPPDPIETWSSRLGTHVYVADEDLEIKFHNRDVGQKKYLEVEPNHFVGNLLTTLPLMVSESAHAIKQLNEKIWIESQFDDLSKQNDPPFAMDPLTLHRVVLKNTVHKPIGMRLTLGWEPDRLLDNPRPWGLSGNPNMLLNGIADKGFIAVRTIIP